MLVSGYHVEFRQETIQAAVVRYKHREARAETGGPSLYRLEEEEKEVDV